MYCAHEFEDGSRVCSRCGALAIPADRSLAHVREARRILERCPRRLDPFTDSAEDVAARQ